VFHNIGTAKSTADCAFPRRDPLVAVPALTTANHLPANRRARVDDAKPLAAAATASQAALLVRFAAFLRNSGHQATFQNSRKPFETWLDASLPVNNPLRRGSFKTQFSQFAESVFSGILPI